jgi:hypothetical protein
LVLLTNVQGLLTPSKAMPSNVMQAACVAYDVVMRKGV